MPSDPQEIRKKKKEKRKKEKRKKEKRKKGYEEVTSEQRFRVKCQEAPNPSTSHTNVRMNVHTRVHTDKY